METMIAAGVISVGLGAVCAGIPIASYSVREGHQLSTATLLAAQRLEQIRAARWELGPPAVDDMSAFVDEPEVGGAYAGYGRFVRIIDCGEGNGCGGGVSADLRHVTVTVTYRPMTGAGGFASGTTKAATVTMYVARR